MKNNPMMWESAYEAPTVSMTEVIVESGFVGSDFESNQTPTFEEDKIEW